MHKAAATITTPAPPEHFLLNRFTGILRKTWSEILDVVFPQFCLGCAREGALLCPACARALIRIPPQCIICHQLRPGSDRAYPGTTCPACRKKTLIRAFFSPFAYQHPLIRSLIHAYKYERAVSLDRVFAKLLLAYLAAQRITLPREAILVPIPLHRGRERQRGFNQAARVSLALGALLGMRVCQDALYRVRPTIPQAGLPRAQRLQNVAGAFSVARPEIIARASIILVDDVSTTGATLHAAAAALRNAGAKKIFAISIAH